MNICVIGDPHGNLDKIKKIPLKNVDLILVTGDLGKADLARERFFENKKRMDKGLSELKYDKKFIKKLYNEIYGFTEKVLNYLSKYAPVYTIQGNVEIPTLSTIKKIEKKNKIKFSKKIRKINSISNVNIIKNRLRIINNLRIGFLEYFTDTSWVREFKPFDYKISMKKAKKETNKANDVLKKFNSLNILICHQPPYGFLDKVNSSYGAPKDWHGKHAGSKAILNYIKKKQPKYVFCGHIHEGEGNKKIGKTKIYNLGVAGHKIIKIRN